MQLNSDELDVMMPGRASEGLQAFDVSILLLTTTQSLPA